MKISKISLFIILFGVIFRLFLTSSGNFLFNMDNARDFVEVREMVEIHKFRLTGPTTAITGLYTGPLWYYLLAIPYVITGGNPYGAIVMEIILWAIGGFFLLKLVERFNQVLVIPVGLIWVASSYILLATAYSFNPSPVTLLSPVFIYALVESIKNQKSFWIITMWLLGGAFLNFEMNAGVFTPVTIFLSTLLLNKKLFSNKYFWLGFLLFLLTLLPQLLFDLKHQFIMSKGVISFLSESRGGFNLLQRVESLATSYWNVFEATLMNHKTLVAVIIILTLPVFKKVFSNTRENLIITVASVFIIIPFLGYIFIPVTVNPWHLGSFAAASLILVAFSIYNLWRTNILGKFLALLLFTAICVFSISKVSFILTNDVGKPDNDPSRFHNEVAAVDYVYKYAKGQNFKAYTYLPSVYDYPYQYLFWWYGMRKYGYLPLDYAYAPNKPQYIPSKEKFSAPLDLKNKDNSKLVFLIKEPNHNYTRFGWEGEFIKLKPIEKVMVGPIEIEIREEL